MTAVTLDPRPRQWSLALAGALLLHLAVALLYIQFADAGTWATGQGGIKVGLGPAGGAPGAQPGEAWPEDVQTAAVVTAEAVEVPPEEAAEVLPAPVEIAPPVPEAAPPAPREAIAAQVPEAARSALPETVPLYAPDVAAEAPPPAEEVAAVPETAEAVPDEAAEVVLSEVVEVEPSEAVEAVEAVEVTETRSAMATPQPPRAKPVVPLEQTPEVELPVAADVATDAPVLETAAAAVDSAAEAAPPGPAPGSAEAAESDGNRGTSGSGSTAASGSAQGRSGGGAAGATTDYKAMLLAWLERHKVYPRRARLRRQEGTAELYFVVDRHGQLLEYRLAKSSGHKLLDEEVTAMIERAAPLPAVPDDPQAQRFVFNVPVSFDLR